MSEKSTSSTPKLQKDRVKSVKEFFEMRYTNIDSRFKQREKEWREHEAQLDRQNLPEPMKEKKRAAYREAIKRLSRLARRRIRATDFEMLKIIGKGAFGQVRLVRKRDTGEIFAMKTMEKAGMVLKNQVTHVRAERNVLALHSDTFCKKDGTPASNNSDPLGQWMVQLNCSFQDRRNLYLVMHFMPGGDLMGLLIEKDTFSEQATRFFAAEMILAIEVVHSLGYIHRDIKPDNFLLDARGHIKLTDLGLCKKVDKVNLPGMEPGGLMGMAATNSNNSSLHNKDEPQPINAPPPVGRSSRHNRNLAQSTVGTPNYIAPEVLLQEGYGMECDWWSLGVIVFECLFGFPPFDSDDQDPMHVCNNIINWKKTLTFPKEATGKLSKDCISFLKGLICHFGNRLGFSKGSKELKQHAWFANVLDFNHVSELEAPYVPEFSEQAESILVEKLRHLDSSDPEFKKLVLRITSKFDDYCDEPLPGEVEGEIGLRGNSFPDYTYNFPPPLRNLLLQSESPKHMSTNLGHSFIATEEIS